MARERHWIVLAEDGRHVTLGRATDPDSAELTTLAETMRAQGMAGWLAVMDGDYHTRRDALTVMQVRALTPINIEWDAAVVAFQDRRSKFHNAA